MSNSEIIIVVDTPEKQQRAMEILQKYDHKNLTAKDAKDFYKRDIITLDELEQLLKNEPEKSQVAGSAVFNADNICFHRPQDRVRPYKGYRLQ